MLPKETLLKTRCFSFPLVFFWIFPHFFLVGSLLLSIFFTSCGFALFQVAMKANSLNVGAHPVEDPNLHQKKNFAKKNIYTSWSEEIGKDGWMD